MKKPLIIASLTGLAAGVAGVVYFVGYSKTYQQVKQACREGLPSEFVRQQKARVEHYAHECALRWPWPQIVDLAKIFPDSQVYADVSHHQASKAAARQD